MYASRRLSYASSRHCSQTNRSRTLCETRLALTREGSETSYSLSDFQPRRRLQSRCWKRGRDDALVFLSAYVDRSSLHGLEWWGLAVKLQPEQLGVGDFLPDLLHVTSWLLIRPQQGMRRSHVYR